MATTNNTPDPVSKQSPEFRLKVLAFKLKNARAIRETLIKSMVEIDARIAELEQSITALAAADAGADAPAPKDGAR